MKFSSREGFVRILWYILFESVGILVVDLLNAWANDWPWWGWLELTVWTVIFGYIVHCIVHVYRHNRRVDRFNELAGRCLQAHREGNDELCERYFNEIKLEHQEMLK